jgi:hypothetical protein
MLALKGKGRWLCRLESLETLSMTTIHGDCQLLSMQGQGCAMAQQSCTGLTGEAQWRTGGRHTCRW